MLAAHLLVRGVTFTSVYRLSVSLDEGDQILERRRAPRCGVVGPHIPEIDVPRVEDKSLRAWAYVLVNVLNAFADIEQLRLLGAQHGE